MREADDPSDIVPDSGPGKRKINPTEKASGDRGGSTPPPRPAKKKKTKDKGPPKSVHTPSSTPATSQNSKSTADSPPVVISVEDKFAHRKYLPRRPSENCAADHPHFKKSSALPFQFLIVLSSESDADGCRTVSKLQCALCHKSSPKSAIWTLPEDWDSSTGNQNKHFREKHEAWWSQVQNIDEEKLPSLRRVRDRADNQKTLDLAFQSSFTWEGFDEKLARWILVSNQPFTETENDEFRELLIYLRPTAKDHLPRADALRDHVMKYCEELRGHIKKMLVVPRRIPIAADAWTSSNRIAFIAIITSWIGEDWCLREALLDFQELSGMHSGANLVNVVFKMLEEFNITDKFLSMTANNASNNKTLICALADLINNRNLASHNIDPAQLTIWCLAHVIHLAVTAGLAELKAVKLTDKDEIPNLAPLSLMEAESITNDGREGDRSDEEIIDAEDKDTLTAVTKIQKISKIVQSSPQQLEDWFGTIKQYNNSREFRTHAAQDPAHQALKPLTLILDVPTRWNSILLMLEWAYLMQDLRKQAIDFLMRRPLYSKYALSTAEWGLIQLLIRWLSLFRDATNQMSETTNVTLSWTIYIYAVLIGHARELQNEAAALNNPDLTAAANSMLHKLEKYIDQSTSETEFYYFAMVLDPRFKNRIFDRMTPTVFQSSWVNQCAAQMRSTLEIDFVDDSDLADSRLERAADTSVNPFYRASDAMLGPTTQTTTHEAPDSELRRYLLEDRAPISSDPLEWWRLNAMRFPLVAKMAQVYLAIPGSSVSVERCFNAGRDVISLRRASLKAETIRNLLTAQSTIKLEKALQQSGN